MSPSRNSAHVSASESSSADIAGREAKKATARSEKALSRMNLLLRAVLFVAACVFSTIGVLSLLDVANTQSVSRTVTVASMRGEPVCHALVLMSYDESDADVAYERDGVLDVLNRASISSDVIYMDARSTAGDASAERRLTEQIEQKATLAGGYDAIVVAGDDALAYIQAHQELFGGVPLAFFGVDDKDLASSVHAAGIGTGYTEDAAAVRVLEQACSLVPDASRAVVLVDGSMQANGMLAQLIPGFGAANPKVRVQGDIWDVSAMTRDELASRLGKLGDDSFVMLLAANRDSTGAVFTPSETAHFLGSSSAVPVFSVTGGVGEGVCGSAFIDSATEGSNAAMLVVDLINGKNAVDVPVQTAEPENMVYDAAALKSHGVDANVVSKDSAVINESIFSWRVIRPYLLPVVYLLIAVACIAAFGIIGFRRSVQSSKAIVASRNDLQYRLYHDLLTDLPNRHSLEQFANGEKTGGSMQSMVQVDIKDFTDINDSYGHAFGDEVIQVLAERLSKVDSSLLARSGGDEFTLVFDHPLAADSRELDRIRQVFAVPVGIGDNRVDAEATIGIANREWGMSSADLIVFSDLALNYAKDNNLRTPVFYTSDMRADMEKKLQITECLKRAIANEDIVVAWQPQVDTKSLEVVGYEALCRLKDNRYAPSEFIPVAEMSGLVIPLDRLMTKKVVEQMGTWLKQGRKVGDASVNFSVAQLRDKGYCDFLADLLRVNEVPASLMKIEITESMIIGNEEAAERLFSRLRDMGVTLALDDFGTGYSSLYQMASRPIDVVKLDKSLVDTFLTPGKEAFIENVAQLIHGLGKSIVVEGVETFEQYQMCLDIGCDVIQGFFFGRPMSAAEIMQLNPESTVAEARALAGDKTRNGDWRKYDRDEHGRWVKKS